MPIILSLIKSRSLAIVRRKIFIKILKNIESSDHIVKFLIDAFTSIGKKSKKVHKIIMWLATYWLSQL